VLLEVIETAPNDNIYYQIQMPSKEIIKLFFIIKMFSPTPPNIFHETFIDSSDTTDTDPRDPWPNLRVARTLNTGVIVPLSDAFDYGDYCLLDKTTPSDITIIRYQYSDPVDLSDIESLEYYVIAIVILCLSWALATIAIK
jgi:hypothetical protein